MTRRVVITGIGLVTPLDQGKGKEAFWAGAIQGVNAVRPISLFDASDYSTDVAAEITSFGRLRLGRWQRFLDMAFDSVIIDSAIGCSSTGMDCGIILGTVLGDILGAEDPWRSGEATPLSATGLSSGAESLAKRYSLRGPVTTISTACASGTDSIGMAFRLIQTGAADLICAGGGDTLSEFAFSGFNSLNAMTRDVVRPFDKDRTGLALGEGAAFLMLEEEVHARRRGARIYCSIAGYASSADANHLTGPDREGRGLARAITAALSEAGIEMVDYINAHGTATPYNDLMETKAYKSVFGPSAYKIPISSIKSMIGHSFGAAGAIEAVTSVMAIERGMLPPTINLVTKDPECDLDYCPDTAREKLITSALSVSAGFGGQNSAIIFRCL
ncbi:MAG: beta-ketoacyl-[acyl-carrier-protein] synthase family protein [Deltaproteobacteria bacterium]